VVASASPPPVCPSLSIVQIPGCPPVPPEVERALGQTGLPVGTLLAGIMLMALGVALARRRRRGQETPVPVDYRYLTRTRGISPTRW
jgi:hypothetical protein